jgi:hypothetical protein
MLYPAVGSGKIRQHTDLDLGVLPWYTRCVAIEMRKSWKINENHHELNQPSKFGVLDFQALSRWDPLFLGSHNLSAQNPQNIPKSFLVLKNQLVTPRLCKKKLVTQVQPYCALLLSSCIPTGRMATEKGIDKKHRLETYSGWKKSCTLDG